MRGIGKKLVELSPRVMPQPTYLWNSFTVAGGGAEDTSPAIWDRLDSLNLELSSFNLKNEKSIIERLNFVMTEIRHYNT